MAAPRSPAPRNTPREFNVPGLAHASVVDVDHRQGPHRADRRKRGAARRRRDRRADAREPAAHGRHRQGLQGRCRARGGSPFRPLYDDKIMFNGQPIALVLAEDWETARFAASLVRVEYEEAAARRPTSMRSAIRPFAWRGHLRASPTKPRGDADKRLRRGRRAPRGRILTSRSSTTIRWSCSPRP